MLSQEGFPRKAAFPPGQAGCVGEAGMEGARLPCPKVLIERLRAGPGLGAGDIGQGPRALPGPGIDRILSDTQARGFSFRSDPARRGSLQSEGPIAEPILPQEAMDGAGRSWRIQRDFLEEMLSAGRVPRQCWGSSLLRFPLPALPAVQSKYR